MQQLPSSHTAQPAAHRALLQSHRLALVALVAVAASGCSVLQEDKVDYRSAKQGNALEVPPDLTQLSRDSRYQVPGATVTASGYQSAQPVAGSSDTATSKVGDVRIERSGSQRWLVVDRPADKLWVPIKDFWQENGFVLTTDQETLGVLETDWAENRAKLPQDFIRSTLGKVLEGLYSTGERDKFRTRLERNAAGGTEIYISHRGMVEVYTDSRKDQTTWQPRPADPELEAEFLRRLMVKLGVSEAQAKSVTATAPAAAASHLTTVDNQSVLQLSDDFDRAWRRVGLALDRTGFTVEDRDRSQGTYFVRYVPESAPDAAKPGLFSRMFGSSKPEAKPAQYRVAVRSSGTTTTVSVMNAQGQPETTASGQRILQLLADDLK